MEMLRARKGDNNGHYKIGAYCGKTSIDQLRFNETIRQRDNYTCQDCGKSQELELLETGNSLAVHHKDGDHQNDTDENCISLCRKCHIYYNIQQREQIRDKEAAEAAVLADNPEWLAKQIESII